MAGVIGPPLTVTMAFAMIALLNACRDISTKHALAPTVRVKGLPLGAWELLSPWISPEMGQLIRQTVYQSPGSASRVAKVALSLTPSFWYAARMW